MPIRLPASLFEECEEIIDVLAQLASVLQDASSHCFEKSIVCGRALRYARTIYCRAIIS